MEINIDQCNKCIFYNADWYKRFCEHPNIDQNNPLIVEEKGITSGCPLLSDSIIQFKLTHNGINNNRRGDKEE